MKLIQENGQGKRGTIVYLTLRRIGKFELQRLAPVKIKQRNLPGSTGKTISLHEVIAALRGDEPLIIAWNR